MPSNTTTATNRYGALAAEIYDIDKPFGALPDTRFHLERFAGFDRPILEPAFGTGRTLVPEMLERCRARCAERGFTPDLRQQRFEDFRYERKFGAILVPVGTFTLIDDVAVARSLFDAGRAWLAERDYRVVEVAACDIDADPVAVLNRLADIFASGTATP